MSAGPRNGESPPGAPPKRASFLADLRGLRKGPWEWLATIVIAIGVVMLMQGFAMILYTWSFATILAGTAMFIVVSHFRE